MNRLPRWPSTPSLAALAVVALTAAASPASSAELTLFLSKATPVDSWATGYGAAFTSTWFQVLALEAEGARVPEAIGDGTMTSLTASACLAPSFGVFTPYAGVGVGVFRQARGDLSETGTLKAFVLGAKVAVWGLVIVKGEYRRLSLSGVPLKPFENRFSIGAGIRF